MLNPIFKGFQAFHCDTAKLQGPEVTTTQFALILGHVRVFLQCLTLQGNASCLSPRFPLKM